MPEEIGVASWTEDKVREIVKDWFIDKPRYEDTMIECIINT